MAALLTLALKDLRLLLRDRAGLFWVLFFPLLMAIFFGSIMGGGDDDGANTLPIAVVDEDGTDASRAFADRLAKSEALRVEPLTRAEAIDAVRKGRLVAYVALAKGFGEAGGLPFGADQPIEVGIDPSRRAEKGYLEGILMQSSFEGLVDQFSDPRRLQEPVRRSIESLDEPLRTPPESSGVEARLSDDQRATLRGFLTSLDTFLGSVDTSVYRRGPAAAAPSIKTVAIAEPETGPRSAFEISFAQAVAWALLGTVASFAMSVVRERVEGTFLRLRVAPLSRGRILAGKGLACALACAATVTLLVLVGSALFGVRVSSPLAMALAVAAAAVCFTGLMMLISTLGRTERAVGGAGWGIMLLMSMLGGGMIPLIAMPGWLQTASHASPVKWAILAMEGAIWRGFSLAEMLLPCAILVGVGGAAFAAGVANFARIER
jgi:ABC-2 type transport system permease protein